MGNDRFPNLNKKLRVPVGVIGLTILKALPQNFLLGMFYWEVVVFQPSFLQGPC